MEVFRVPCLRLFCLIIQCGPGEHHLSLIIFVGNTVNDFVWGLDDYLNLLASHSLDCH
jgi:hypothetical protein